MAASWERYGPGQEATGFRPGDFLLTHRHHLLPRLISWAERRRFRGRDATFAHWSHCALIVDGGGGLVEAEAHGVERSPISKYRSEEYHLVRLGDRLSEQSRALAVAYAGSQVGASFGFLVLLSLGAWLLTGVRVRLARREHQICSGLVVHALQKAGDLAAWDATFVLPADLARHFGVRWDATGAAYETS